FVYTTEIYPLSLHDALPILPFWEWLIADIRSQYPEVIFLSEAFTRPAMMARLGKVGFSQSYSYFTWRNTKRELAQYFSELNESPDRKSTRLNSSHVKTSYAV